MSLIILGIDTSCDDTSAAIVADGTDILSNVVSNQDTFHKKFQGVVPEIASRKHLELLPLVVDQALSEAGLSFKDLNAIAVTQKPGLIVSLVVGIAYAKALAYAGKIPLLAVDHIQGHVYSNLLTTPDLPFPHLCLVASGGHTLLLKVNSPLENEIIGSTLDDAAGEAFDKIAKLLDIGYPGGPAIEKIAKTTRHCEHFAKQSQEESKLSDLGLAAKEKYNKLEFPRPMLKDTHNYNFSFSGLKTAVSRYLQAQQNSEDSIVACGAAAKDQKISKELLAAIAAEFQKAVVEVLVHKTLSAASNYCLKIITLAGGVAANSFLREELIKKAKTHGMKVYYPELNLCTDNAAMIAGLAYHLYQARRFADWELDGDAQPYRVK